MSYDELLLTANIFDLATKNGKFGNGDNYSKFETDGTLVSKGTATTYEDIFLAIHPKELGIGQPTLRTLDGDIRKYTMAVNDIYDIDCPELLHCWEEGSGFEVHIHWATRGLNDATARGVKFKIEGLWSNIKGKGSPESFVAMTGSPFSSEKQIPANEPDLTYYNHSIFSYTPVGGKIGACLLLSLKRIASVNNIAPANDPWILMVGIHIKKDTSGSRTTTNK